MANQAILIASILLLSAFAVERLGRWLGLPSVIVLILLGFAAKPLMTALGFAMEGLDVAVPILGTVGLVLIVLEGAMDIELRRERLRSAAGAASIAVLGFALNTFLFSLVAIHFFELPVLQGLIVAIPFSVISSAVAIPSSSFLDAHGREFVVYESSISDIVGVMVFFAILGSDGSLRGVVESLLGGGLVSLLLAILFSFALVLVLVRIDGHVRFIPLLAGLFGLYATGKLLHLSPLVMVLMFGLALNNLNLIAHWRPVSRWMDQDFAVTITQFKVLTQELTFAVRGFFFILLGYWTEPAELFALQAWLTASVILLLLYGGRFVLLKVFRIEPFTPLLWLAPRGLITVLLFLTAQTVVTLPDYMSGTTMLVVIASAGLITVGRYGSNRASKSQETAVAPIHRDGAA